MWSGKKKNVKEADSAKEIQSKLIIAAEKAIDAYTKGKKEEDLLDSINKIKQVDDTSSKKKLLLNTDKADMNILMHCVWSGGKGVASLLELISSINGPERTVPLIDEPVPVSESRTLLTKDLMSFDSEMCHEQDDFIEKLYTQQCTEGWNLLMLTVRYAAEELSQIVRIFQGLSFQSQLKILRQKTRNNTNLFILSYDLPEKFKLLVDLIPTYNLGFQSEILFDVGYNNTSLLLCANKDTQKIVSSMMKRQPASIQKKLISHVKELRVKIAESAVDRFLSDSSGKNFENALKQLMQVSDVKEQQMLLLKKNKKDVHFVSLSFYSKCKNSKGLIKVLRNYLNKGVSEEGSEAVIFFKTLFMHQCKDGWSFLMYVEKFHPESFLDLLEIISKLPLNIQAGIYLLVNKHGQSVVSFLDSLSDRELKKLFDLLDDLDASAQAEIVRLWSMSQSDPCKVLKSGGPGEVSYVKPLFDKQSELERKKILDQINLDEFEVLKKDLINLYRNFKKEKYISFISKLKKIKRAQFLKNILLVTCKSKNNLFAWAIGYHCDITDLLEIAKPLMESDRGFFEKIVVNDNSSDENLLFFAATKSLLLCKTIFELCDKYKGVLKQSLLQRSVDCNVLLLLASHQPELLRMLIPQIAEYNSKDVIRMISLKKKEYNNILFCVMEKDPNYLIDALKLLNLLPFQEQFEMLSMKSSSGSDIFQMAKLKGEIYYILLKKYSEILAEKNLKAFIKSPRQLEASGPFVQEKSQLSHSFFEGMQAGKITDSENVAIGASIFE